MELHNMLQTTNSISSIRDWSQLYNVSGMKTSSLCAKMMQRSAAQNVITHRS